MTARIKKGDQCVHILFQTLRCVLRWGPADRRFRTFMASEFGSLVSPEEQTKARGLQAGEGVFA